MIDAKTSKDKDGKLVLFRTTSASNARAIMCDGFRDSTGSYLMVGIELTGVWLSDEPLDENNGGCSEAVLSITFEQDAVDFDYYECVEDGKYFREWCMPAELVNRFGQVKWGDRLEEEYSPHDLEVREKLVEEAIAKHDAEQSRLSGKK